MNKAAQLAAKLEGVDVASGMKIIEGSKERSLYFDIIHDAMCIMHSDGSVNIIDYPDNGTMTVEVISSGSIL